MADLRPCIGCLRHVRANEARCPFCEASLEVVVPLPLVCEARLGRAARMAFSAAMATASLTGCGNSSTGADTTGVTPIAAESARAAATTEPTTPLPPTTPPAAVPPHPFLVTGSPSGGTQDTGSAVVPPKDTAKAIVTVPPKVTATAPPKVTATATATAVRDRNWGNHAKPYGAPPADGLLKVV